MIKMKVKCITDQYSYLTKDKYYKVHLNIYLLPYIIDDSGHVYGIDGCEEEFSYVKYDDGVSQKTLRDEFAMSAIQGILTTMASPMGDIDTDHHEYISRGAYSIADAMLEVRNENEQTKK